MCGLSQRCKGNFSDVTAQVLGPNPPGFATPRDYCVADFNGDGRADVFIANTGECPGCALSGGKSALLLQTADGRLSDVTATNLPQTLSFTHNVACGDIDGDGDIDLYLANQIATGDGAPQIYLNDGQGHFTAGDSSRLPSILQTTSPWQFVNISARFIDFNKDGTLICFWARTAGTTSHMICCCSTTAMGSLRQRRPTPCPQGTGVGIGAP